MSSAIHIELSKEDFRFSAAHMTVFGKNSKESLHGHNYRIGANFTTRAPGVLETIPFDRFKQPIRELCASWHERVLIAEKCPYLAITSRAPFRFTLCGKSYELPDEDVVLLPIDNVSCESLCQHFLEELVKRLASFFNSQVLTGLAVTVWESPGQGVTAHYHV